MAPEGCFLGGGWRWSPRPFMPHSPRRALMWTLGEAGAPPHLGPAWAGRSRLWRHSCWLCPESGQVRGSGFGLCGSSAGRAARRPSLLAPPLDLTVTPTPAIAGLQPTSFPFLHLGCVLRSLCPEEETRRSQQPPSQCLTDICWIESVGL